MVRVYEDIIGNYKFRQSFAAAVASLALLSSGIHYAWPGPSLPRLLEGEFPFPVSNEEASYITVIGPVGDILGVIVTAVLVDKIGRKTTLVIFCIPQLISFLLIYISYYEKSFLFIARFLGGVSEGCFFTIAGTYVAEIAEKDLRGVLGCLVGTVFSFGTLFVNCIGSYLPLQTSALIYMAVPLINIILFQIIPETPYYYLMKGRTNAAKKSLTFLRKSSQVDSELQFIKTDVEKQLEGQTSFRSLYMNKTYRTACLLICGLRFLQQFSGFYAMMTYTQIFLKGTHFVTVSKEATAIALTAIQSVIALAISFIADRVGRKPLLVISCIGCTVASTTEAIYFTVHDLIDENVENFSWIAPIGLFLTVISCSIGFVTVISLITAELFPVSIKKKALSVTTCCYALSMFLSGKFYQYTADNVGQYLPFYTFALCELLGIFFCWKLLPETKNKTLADIQEKIKMKCQNKTEEQ